MDVFMLPVPIFKWVVSVSPIAVMTIGLILILRNWVGKRANPKIFYFLWLLLMIRLLCPWFPASLISLWNVVPNALNMKAINESMDSIPSIFLEKTADEWSNKQETLSIVPIENESFHISTVSWLDIAYIVWFVGVLVLTVCYVFTYIRWNQRLKNETLHNLEFLLDRWFSECKERLGITKDISIKITSLVSTPATYGLWKPRILIPKEMIGRLDEDDWKCIFLHELIHIQRKDALWNWLMFVLVILHWFNPLMWKAYIKMREDQEMSCDLKTLEHVDNVHYGNTLIKMLELNHKMNRLSLVPFISGEKKLIRRRIEMIFSKKKPALSLIIIGILSVFVAIIFTNPSITAKTQDTESTISFSPPTSGNIVIHFGDMKRINKVDEIKSVGIEVVNIEGTPVYAAADGVIEQSEYVPIEGNRIQISHSEQYKTIYGHLKDIHVEIGQTVEKGQIIGTMGSTGRSTGPHLLFKVLKNDKFVNPEELIDFTK